MRPLQATITAMLLAAIATACDDDSTTPETPEEPAPNTRVEVWPDSLALNLLQSFALEMKVENLPSGQSPTFNCTSSDIAVATSSGCVVRALSPGTVNVMVTSPHAATPALVKVTVSSQVPSCPALFGDRFFSMTVSSDSGGRAPSIGMPANIQLTITRNVDNTVTIFAGSPFIVVGGLVDASCNVVAVGSGTAGGTANVSVRLAGGPTQAGPIVFEYTLGLNGALPGGKPVVYRLTQL